MLKLFITSIAFLCLLMAGTSYAQSTTFDTSGSWTCPAGVTAVIVECWGGGGGGGYVVGNSTSSSYGTGGGGSCYSRKVVSVVPGTTYMVNVGVGGAGGNAVNIDGQAGGDTWFKSVTDVLAKGGSGGTGNNPNTFGTTGSGSVPGSIGDTVFTGGNGGGGRSGSFSTPRAYGGGGGGSAGDMENGKTPDFPASSPGAAGNNGGGNGGNGGGAAYSGGGAGLDGNVPGGGAGILGTEPPTVSFNGGNGASGRVIITPTTPLPIGLISFSASTAKGNNILFKWEAVSRNVKSVAYSIEASPNGEKFKEIYSEKHAGTIPHEYTYVYSFQGKAALYYRLKYAFDGNIARYSNVIRLNGNNLENTAISLYPNPSGNTAFISYNSAAAGSVSVSIHSIEGRKVFFRNYVVEQGDNRLRLDIQSLHAGTYSVQMLDSNGRELFEAMLTKQH